MRRRQVLLPVLRRRQRNPLQHLSRHLPQHNKRHRPRVNRHRHLRTHPPRLRLLSQLRRRRRVLQAYRLRPLPLPHQLLPLPRRPLLSLHQHQSHQPVPLCRLGRMAKSKLALSPLWSPPVLLRPRSHLVKHLMRTTITQEAKVSVLRLLLGCRSLVVLL